MQMEQVGGDESGLRQNWGGGGGGVHKQNISCLVDDCESHISIGGECKWVVLHHTFQSCGAFECCLRTVGVLWVDKLSHNALGVF